MINQNKELVNILLELPTRIVKTKFVDDLDQSSIHNDDENDVYFDAKCRSI